MELRFKVTPYIVTKYSREEIVNSVYQMNNIGIACFTMNSRYGHYFGQYKDKHNNEFIIVFNIQKFNKKTKQTQKVDKTGKNITTSEIVRRKHFVGYIYKIPKIWLDITENKVIQKNYNFYFESNKII